MAVEKFLLISAAVAVLSSYYGYKQLNNIPPLPKVDPEEYWGPYPMQANPDLSIRPFEIEFSDVMINDLRERLLHRRPFAPPLDNTGSTYGFNTHFLTQVLDYWQNKYNFRDREQFFNKYPQYKTNVQGLDIHFMRVRPDVDENVTVVPVLLLHGWPGSFREFYELVPKLTTPRPDVVFVFEIIAPSLPGYGFSQAASRPGLGALEVAVIMNNLMQRLGHSKYYVQGGDCGHQVGANMATLYPDNLLGFHTNMPFVMHKMALVWTFLGSFWPSLVVEKEFQDRMYPAEERIAFLLAESGYVHLQATKPDTVGVGLTDSPAGLAAYILEKFSTWTNPEHRHAADGRLLVKFSLTHLLDNIMVYWATNSITTSMRMYAETLNKRHFQLEMDHIPTRVPTWGLKTKHELVYQPDSFLRYKYSNYLHSTVAAEGGHFVAMEAPDLLADDLFRAVFLTSVLFHANFGKPHSPAPTATQQETNYKTAKTIHEFTVKDAYGRDVKLDKYRGHVLIIVNVASQCGLTDTNYNQLNELYEKYSTNRGLRILAFPCNQFGYQESGTIQEIIQFTKEKGIKFDLFSKIEVNGENAHPLWKFLKESQSGTVGDFIKWNFTKFIVDKNGVPVARFGPTDEPINMEPHLAKYW